jgi:hypothetical protein
MLVKKYLTAIIFLTTIFQNIYAQYDHFSIPKHTALCIRQALDCIYNQNYIEAEYLIEELEQEVPGYPGVGLLKAYFVQWKYGPMTEKNGAFTGFLAICDSTIEISESMLANDPESAEAQFFILSIHAMLARAYIDSGSNWKAIKEAQKAYRFIKSNMERIQEFPEFNLYCGLYNYYREKYPEDNHFVKPILWIFMDGDKDLGLKMLNDGSQVGLFVKLECMTYLYHIRMRYEFEPGKSINFSRELHELYPQNEYYIALLTENLIFLDEFCAAKPLLDILTKSSSPYFQYAGLVYRGLLSELYLADLVQAENHYRSALIYGESKQITTPHFKSICNLGLGRIYIAHGNAHEAKGYLKNAEKISEYSFIRDEAKRILETL